jgi:hypothetical protein
MAAPRIVKPALPRRAHFWIRRLPATTGGA